MYQKAFGIVDLYDLYKKSNLVLFLKKYIFFMNVLAIQHENGDDPSEVQGHWI